MSKKPHTPTAVTRKLVELQATIGTPQESIALLLEITDKTLRKHYRRELDVSLIKANGSVGGALFNKAKGGDTTAMIFWMKTRAGWREQKEEGGTAEELTTALASLISKLPS